MSNGKIFVRVFFLCWGANLLSPKRTPVRDLSMKLLGYPRALRRSLKFERHSSKVVCEEFIQRSLVASPLIKPRFTPGGWQEVKCVYWKVSVGL